MNADIIFLSIVSMKFHLLLHGVTDSKSEKNDLIHFCRFNLLYCSLKVRFLCFIFKYLICICLLLDSFYLFIFLSCPTAEQWAYESPNTEDVYLY